MTPNRRILPQRRFAETLNLTHGEQRGKYKVTIGYFPDGKIGEVFVNAAKVGSEAESIARDGAILLSLAIQHSVPIDTIRHAIGRNEDGSPSTIIGTVVDELIKRAPSVK
jgi:hypothetical protein